MLHAARPRGPQRGHRGESRTGKQRERFETETRAGSATLGQACRDVVMPSCRAGTARTDVARCIRARLPTGLQSPHSAAYARTDTRARPGLLRATRRHLTGAPCPTYA